LFVASKVEQEGKALRVVGALCVACCQVFVTKGGIGVKSVADSLGVELSSVVKVGSAAGKGRPGGGRAFLALGDLTRKVETTAPTGWTRSFGGDGATGATPKAPAPPRVAPRARAPTPARDAPLPVILASEHASLRARGATTSPEPRGLRNLGNTCYLNATLQALAHTRLLRRAYGDPQSALTLAGRASPALHLAILRHWTTPEAGASTPAPLLRVLRQLAPRFEGRRHQDAHEALRVLLDTINDEEKVLPRIAKALLAMPNDPPPPWTRDSLRIAAAGDLKIVRRALRGRLRSTIVCAGCGNTSSRTEEYFDLSLEIPATDVATGRPVEPTEEEEDESPVSPVRRPDGDQRVSTLAYHTLLRNPEVDVEPWLRPPSQPPFDLRDDEPEEPTRVEAGGEDDVDDDDFSPMTVQRCLEAFTSPERLDGYRCDLCKVRDQSWRQLTLERAPPILQLHLKRFQPQWTGNWIKDSRHVEFPETLRMSRYFQRDRPAVPDDGEDTDFDSPTVDGSLVGYTLTSIVVHMGSISYGHYVAYARGPDDGVWRYASDEDVSVVSGGIESVKHQMGYILVYERDREVVDEA
jgi:ubiquitin C-terminal hydrolase